MRTKVSSLLYLVLIVGGILAGFSWEAAAQRTIAAWPSMESQLAADRVIPGSALERLVWGNQNFDLLNPSESRDKIGIPLWLRVLWRKEHPELTYSSEDPTGGYPRALKNIHQWMASHQDLLPGEREPDIAPSMK